MRIPFPALLLLFGVVLLARPALVEAETLTWRFRSEYKYSVNLEFYARDRKHIWPGSGKVYALRDSQTHTFTLDCKSGEWICFGAWSRGNSKKFWGVGKDRVSGCENCCCQCNGGSTDVRTLTPHSPAALRDKNRRY